MVVNLNAAVKPEINLICVCIANVEVPVVCTFIIQLRKPDGFNTRELKPNSTYVKSSKSTGGPNTIGIAHNETFFF